MGQQGMTGSQTRLDAIVPFKCQLRHVIEAPLFQRLSVAIAARARVANVEGAADEGDLLMANARQMRNGLHRALPVVGLHNIGFQTRTGSHQQHDGDFRLLQHAMLRDREGGGSLIQDDSIDPLGEQKIQIQRLFVPLVVTVAKKHAVARLLGGVLSGSHDCREEGIGDVGHHDAQGVGLLFGQAAGQQIWAIVQLANRGFHAPAQSGAHAPVVVDHCGHGEYRNFGFARHVVNTRRFGYPPCQTGSSFWLAHKQSGQARLAHRPVKVRLEGITSSPRSGFTTSTAAL